MGFNFDPLPGKTQPHLGCHVGTQNHKSLNNLQNSVQKAVQNQNVLPRLSRNGPMCDPYSKYHRFHEVKKCPFGRLLNSFWLPVGVTFGIFLQKVVIRGPKNSNQKTNLEIDEKWSCG